MPNGSVAIPTQPNKELYNGGAEWQNDFGDLPDLQQTFFRMYDAALGRWTGVDSIADATESLSIYQYANNNPVMFNDPLGDVSRAEKFMNDYFLAHSVFNADGTYNVDRAQAEMAGGYK